MVSPKVQYLVIALIGICVVFTATCIEGAPMPSSAYYNEVDATPEDVLFELLQRFGKTILRARNDLENSKRTVDFGLARGYSGIQEAKHRMGLAAANFAGGPGRKRRSLLDV